MSELDECVSGSSSPAQEVEIQVLLDSVTGYLRSLPEETRNIFICRYYFADSIKEIAGYNGYSQSKIKSLLHRTRIGLRKHLEQDGFFV